MNRTLVRCICQLIAIVAIQSSMTAGGQLSLSYRSSPSAAIFVQNRADFKPISSFSGMRGNGVRFCINLYESSDGIGLSQTVEPYGSPAQANAELKRRVRRANEIIKRDAETDSHGRVIKQSIVALFTASRGRKAYASVIGTNGATLYLIESTSLDHVLKFSGAG